MRVPQAAAAVVASLCLLISCLVAAEPADEVNAVVARFKAEFGALAISEETTAAPVKATYVRELERLRDSAKTRGDLNAVLDFEAAIAAAGRDAEPLPAKVAAPALKVARATYDRNLQQALRLLEPKRTRLEADYSRTMTELEQRYTRGGNLEAAKLAREARLMVPGGSADVLPAMTGPREAKEGLVVLKDDGVLKTEASFRPPIEIEYTLRTDNQVRLGYAAGQIILNWEKNRDELRVDGGPVGGQHRKGAGGIPTKQMITIKQVVLPGQMVLSVDGRERARWAGDFTDLNKPIAIHAAGCATLQIKQITVRKLR